MRLSAETIKLRQERGALRRELENPTPQEKAEEERYWRENSNLFEIPRQRAGRGAPRCGS